MKIVANAVVALLCLTVVIAGCLMNTGCMGYMKAGPTGPITSDVTKFLSTPTQPMTIPGSAIGPEYSGSTFTITPRNGTNVTIEKWDNVTGIKTFSLTSEYASNIERIYAGSLGLNESAYNEAGNERQWISQEREFWTGFIKDTIIPAMGSGSLGSGNSGGGGSQGGLPSIGEIQSWLNWARQNGLNFQGVSTIPPLVGGVEPDTGTPAGSTPPSS